MRVKQEIYANWADQWIDEMIAVQSEVVYICEEDLEDFDTWLDSVEAQHLGDEAQVAAWEAEQMIIDIADDYCPF